MAYFTEWQGTNRWIVAMVNSRLSDLAIGDCLTFHGSGAGVSGDDLKRTERRSKRVTDWGWECKHIPGLPEKVTLGKPGGLSITRSMTTPPILICVSCSCAGVIPGPVCWTAVEGNGNGSILPRRPKQPKTMTL